jgi:hypothetical protein
MNQTRRTGITSAPGSMTPSAFVSAVAREVEQYFAKAGRPLHKSMRSWLAQFWWGEDRSVHYELWVHGSTLKLEMGLHFESTGARNRALYLAFGKHLVEIHAALGDTLWLEEWDKGWTRLYETVPLFPLDDARVYAIAGRLSDIMETLQPMYEALDTGG